VSYGRRRAATLALVYLLFTLHIVHWRLAGATLAPLELNEVMYTLELGIVTGGFLFMCLAGLSVAIFGRFFCSWGCHVLALEDLSAWLLAKVGITPRPIRSRVLLLVPVGALLYMFVWPQVSRVLEGRPLPRLRVLTDADGWASFVTTDVWRNLPGPWIASLTLIACGAVMVYALGSRAFCTYGCPYGVVFGWLDRLAPRRIVATDECLQCGACTAACPSHIAVHEEIATFGQVTNSACLKDLECVTACPNGVLSYGKGRRTPLSSPRRFGTTVPYDFTFAEDVLMGTVFVASLLVFRGLYGAVPFLMTLGVGGILAYLAVVSLRLLRRSEVSLSHLRLKEGGRVTTAGAVWIPVLGLVALFVLHSGWIRYHEVGAERAFRDLQGAVRQGDVPSSELLAKARRHLETCLRWGIVRPTPRLLQAASVHRLAGSSAEAERRLRAVLKREPGDLRARLTLAEVLLSADRPEEARAELSRVAEGAPEGDDAASVAVRATAFELLGRIDLDAGDHDSAAQNFSRAIALDFERAGAHEALGTLLAEDGSTAEAMAHLELAARLKPDSSTVHFNLGMVLERLGRTEEAETALRRALELNPDLAQVPQSRTVSH